MQSIPPRKVKLMKMSKGYQWEISCAEGADFETILEDIKKADAILKIMYGNDG